MRAPFGNAMRRHWLHEYDKNMQENIDARAQIESDQHVVQDSELGVATLVVIRDAAHMYERIALWEVEKETWHKMVLAMNNLHNIAVNEAHQHELLQLRAELLHKIEFLMQRDALLRDNSEVLTIELHRAHACLQSKKHRRPIATCRAGNAPNSLMSYPRKKGTPIKS